MYQDKILHLRKMKNFSTVLEEVACVDLACQFARGNVQNCMRVLGESYPVDIAKSPILCTRRDNDDPDERKDEEDGHDEKAEGLYLPPPLADLRDSENGNAVDVEDDVHPNDDSAFLCTLPKDRTEDEKDSWHSQLWIHSKTEGRHTSVCWLLLGA